MNDKGSVPRRRYVWFLFACVLVLVSSPIAIYTAYLATKTSNELSFIQNPTGPHAGVTHGTAVRLEGTLSQDSLLSLPDAFGRPGEVALSYKVGNQRPVRVESLRVDGQAVRISRFDRIALPLIAVSDELKYQALPSGSIVVYGYYHHGTIGRGHLGRLTILAKEDEDLWVKDEWLRLDASRKLFWGLCTFFAVLTVVSGATAARFWIRH